MDGMRIAVVEDSADDRDQIVDYCKAVGEELSLVIDTLEFDSLAKFRRRIREVRPDLLIVDLRLERSMEDRSGWKVVEKVLRREIVPVIIYSGYSSEEPPEKYKLALVARVIKGEEQITRFKDTLVRFLKLKSRFKEEKVRILGQFEKVSLETLRALLRDAAPEDLNENILAVMAVGRLRSFLGNSPPGEEERFPAEFCFIYPPLEMTLYPKESLLLGDFLEQRRSGRRVCLLLVVSPSCDIVYTNTRKSKIDNVLVLPCYTRWTEVPFLKEEGNESSRRSKVKNRARSKTIKIIKCPSVIFGNRYLLISFKDYKTVPYEVIKKGIRSGRWKRLATLAMPYAENVQNNFLGDLSRIGTPETSLISEEDEWLADFVKKDAAQNGDVSCN
jgi:CheY-like chemotaxis protein